MSDNTANEFDNKISRLSESTAYLNFCEEVYGYKMPLFNMTDKEQLDYIFSSIPISQLLGKKLFDSGRASRYLYCFSGK